MWSIHDCDESSSWAYYYRCNWFTLVVLYRKFELAFSGCSVWWGIESQKLLRLSWGTLLGAGRSKNWLVLPYGPNLGASLNQIFCKISYIVRAFHTFENSGAYRRGILVSNFKVPPTAVMEYGEMYQDIHWAFFELKRKMSLNFRFHIIRRATFPFVGPNPKWNAKILTPQCILF